MLLYSLSRQLLARICFDLRIIESIFSALASISFIWQDQDIGITYH